MQRWMMFVLLCFALMGCDRPKPGDNEAAKGGEPAPEQTADQAPEAPPKPSAPPKVPLEAEGDPLEPLAALGVHLQQAVDKVTAGKNMEVAFSPWVLSTKAQRQGSAAQLRQDLKKARVASAKLASFQFGLAFLKEERIALHLRTMVTLLDGAAGFIMIKTTDQKKVAGQVPIGAHAFGVFQGPLTPFQLGAQRLVKLVRARKDCEATKLVDHKALIRFLGDHEASERLERKITKGRTQLATTCYDVEQAKHDDIWLHVDRVSYITYDDQGKAIGTLDVRLSWRKGQLEVTPEKLRTF